MNKKHAVKSYYDRYAGQYDSFYQEIQLDKFNHVSAYIDFSPIHFDLGGGSGLFSTWISSYVVNLDISHKMLMEGLTHGRQFQGVAADLEHLPLRVKTIKNFISLTAIQNCYNPVFAISELKRVLSPNFTGIITFLRKSNLANQVQEEIYSLEYQIENIPYPGEDYCFMLSNHPQ